MNSFDRVQFIDDRTPIPLYDNIIDELLSTVQVDKDDMPNIEILSNAISEEPDLIVDENEGATNVATTNTLPSNEKVAQNNISLKQFINKFHDGESGHKLYQWRFQIAYLEATGFSYTKITEYLNSNGVEISYQGVRGYLKARSGTRLFVKYEVVGENKSFTCTTGYLNEAISKIIKSVGDGKNCVVKFEQRYLTNCEWEDLVSE